MVVLCRKAGAQSLRNVLETGWAGLRDSQQGGFPTSDADKKIGQVRKENTTTAASGYCASHNLRPLAPRSSPSPRNLLFKSKRRIKAAILLIGCALDRLLKWQVIEIDGSLDARDSGQTPAQGKAAQTFILCSSPPNRARLCDLGACSRALTARLSTFPHRFTFGFPALCRTG
jgi:hypothetical protein